VADTPQKYDKKSRYTEGRGIAGAFEGETVTRRRLMEGTAAAVGGIATMAFALPGLGFALGPIFEDTNPTIWQDVGAEGDFNPQSYVPRVMSIDPEIGDAGKTTIYVRKFSRDIDEVVKGQDPQPYVVISRSSDGELVANRFFPSDLRFCNEGDAIAHARDWAVRWIDASNVTV